MHVLSSQENSSVCLNMDYGMHLYSFMNMERKQAE